MTDLFVDSWGNGTSVVLVHGSLATGARSGSLSCRSPSRDFAGSRSTGGRYGRSPAAAGEDFLVDAEDLAEIWATPRISSVTPTGGSGPCAPPPAAPKPLSR